MEYYCLACKTGCESINIKMLKTVCRSKLGEGQIDAYSPVRIVRELKEKKFHLVRQPMLPGYIIIYTDYDLASISSVIAGMTASSYGLIRNLDKSYQLKGDDKAYAEWISRFEGVIRESQVKVEKDLQEGSRVTVLSGPLKELKGRIIRLYKKTRVLVEIPFLNEVRRINLPVEVVEETGEEVQE